MNPSSGAMATKSPDIIEITAHEEGMRSYLRRIWQYRALARVLAARSIRITYSQTALGLAWAVIQPTVAIVIYSVFFYSILGIDTGATPYPVFVFPGVIAWFHFAQIFSDAGSSLQKSQELIRKVEFPRIILPISQVLSGLVFVGISFLLMIVLLLIFRVELTWRIAFFPFFLVLNLIAGSTIAIWLSALSFRYRDLQHIVPYLLNYLIWVTPVFYPTTILGPKYEYLLYLNPMAGIVSGYRWSLVGTGFPEWQFFLPLIPLILLFVGGVFYFKRVDRVIEDYI
ncbi:MAG: ABC transporter permease [Bacteroidota bacterium]